MGVTAIEKGVQRIATAGAREAPNAQSLVRKLTTSTVPTKAKPFTKHNYRENLIWLTGINPGKEVHAHHIFPQKFRKELFEKGINIDDPKYLTWWGSGSHLPNASEYNAKWDRIMNQPGETTADQILQEGRRMMSKYGIETNY